LAGAGAVLAAAREGLSASVMPDPCCLAVMVDCRGRMRIIAAARRSNARPNHDRNAAMPMSPPETIQVDQENVACDGGGGALGHPRVYLTLDGDGKVDCPYCGRHFILKPGAQRHAGH